MPEQFPSRIGVGDDPGVSCRCSPVPFRFDARDFGATGDGVSDDTAAIQAACDAATAAAAAPVSPAGQTAGERVAAILSRAGSTSPQVELARVTMADLAAVVAQQRRVVDAQTVGDIPSDNQRESDARRDIAYDLRELEIMIDLTPSPESLAAFHEAMRRLGERMTGLPAAVERVGAAARQAASTAAELMAAIGEQAPGGCVPASTADPIFASDMDWPAPDGAVCAHVCGPNPDHRCDARAMIHLKHKLPSGGVRQLPLCAPCYDAETAALDVAS